MIDINKPSEGLDYVIEPFAEIDNSQAWAVTVKTGQYKGAALLFTHITYNGKVGSIRFHLDAATSEGEWLPVDGPMEDYAFYVLQDIIKNGLANGSIILDDKDTDNGIVARKQTVPTDSA